VKNYYELLSIEASAPPETIKRAFRVEIARYHPDKVQHLGKEFQEMAATRAAQLTQAYRTLMNADLRAEYDRLLQTPHTEPGGPRPHASPPPAPPATPPPSAPASDGSPPGTGSEPSGRRSTLFSEERSTGDEFVRKAALGLIRKILQTGSTTYTELPIRGFDLVSATQKSRLFGKSQPIPNLFVRLVRQVDRAAIQETWVMAAKALAAESAEACILLLGTVTSQREANEAAAALRRQPGRAAPSLVLIPIDIRDWSAHVPHDAPRSCKAILEKLKKTT
jgi:curved DNA-binding protein CbpA